jgi:hypothetical protein
MPRKKSDRYEAVHDYIATIQEELGLTEWRVVVSREPANDDCYAETQLHDQSQNATVALAHKFWSITPEEQRVTLIHEVLHLDTWRCSQMVDRLEDVIGTVAWAMFEPLWEDEWERLVDRHATRIADKFPLPHFA